MKARNANLFLLTDYDAAGLSISSKVKEAPRIGVDILTPLELGLKFEDVSEEYTPRKQNLSDVPPMDKEFLSKKRIEIDSILAHAGAEKFWNHLLVRMLEISPRRDLNRSLNIESILPEELEEALRELGQILKKHSDNKKRQFEIILSNWDNGFVYINEYEQGINRKLKEIIRESEDYLQVLSAINELLKSLKN